MKAFSAVLLYLTSSSRFARFAQKNATRRKICILQILHYGHWDRHYRLCCVKLSCPSLIALFPVVFHSANFWKIQICIDSNFRLTTTCCYPYISLGSFSKLILNNMSFWLWWVRYGSDTLPWHMVSSFMIPWCLWMRHQSFKFKWQMAVTYTEAIQRSLMDGKNDEAQGFPLSAYCHILWPMSTSPNHFLLTKGIKWLATLNILDCMAEGKLQ